MKTPLSEALEYGERLGLAGGKCGGPGAAQLLTQEPSVQDGQLLPHLQKRQGKCQANSVDCEALNGVLSKVFYSNFSQKMNSLHEQSLGLSLEIEKNTNYKIR